MKGILVGRACRAVAVCGIKHAALHNGYAKCARSDPVQNCAFALSRRMSVSCIFEHGIGPSLLILHHKVFNSAA